jgi:hypothetical protein
MATSLSKNDIINVINEASDSQISTAITRKNAVKCLISPLEIRLEGLITKSASIHDVAENFDFYTKMVNENNEVILIVDREKPIAIMISVRNSLIGIEEEPAVPWEDVANGLGLPKKNKKAENDPGL